MPRPRYPSDDRRRRQRPHIKVHLSIVNHPTYGQVFGDPLMRGIVGGIWLVGARAHISATKDQLTLSRADALWITGTERMVDAIKVLTRVCKAMNYEFRRTCDVHSNCPGKAAEKSPRVVGEDPSTDPFAHRSPTHRRFPVACQRPARWVVYVRNFSRKQGFTPRSATDSGVIAEDSATSDSEEPKNRSYAPRSAPHSKEKKEQVKEQGEFIPEYWKNKLKDQLKAVPKAGSSLKEILDRDFKKS